MPGTAPEPSPQTAVQAADALVRAEALVVVLSEDLALLQSMDEARLAGRFIAVASLERFVDQLVSGSVAVAVIDCSLVPEPSGQFMLRLRDQFPCLALIAAGDGTDQGSISGLIADGTVCRFVHKPASGQRLALFVEAALRQHAVLLRDWPSIAPLLPGPGVRSSQRRPLLITLLTATLLGVALYFYWQYYRSPPEAGEAEPEPAAVGVVQPPAVANASAPALAPTPIDAVTPLAKLLDQARQRMASGALLEPPGDNARQYISAAHALAPDDPQVRAAALKLGDLIIAATRRAIAAGSSDDAQRWLSAAADYQINAATLESLRRRVNALDQPAEALPIKQPARPVPSAPAAAREPD